jgi:hypothetical protein
MTGDRVEHFVGLETDVWEALVAGDAAADRRLLCADFLGIYPQGFEGRTEHAAHLVDGPVMAGFAITDALLVELAHDTVLLAYRADYRPIVAGVQGVDETMYISSIWCRRGGEWLNVFSQDTPAARPTDS